MDQNLKIYSILEKNSVSRETCIEFEHFISLIIENNKTINLISRGDEQNIRERHVIDCAQALDFIDLNSNICIDLGSGNGMPGIILAIMMKNMKLPIKFNLYEKSYHKSKFLESVSKKLNLNTEVIQKDIFKIKNINTGSIIGRAFKPLPDILELINQNFSSYKNLILFMGKNGKQILKDAFKQWDFEYKEKRSLTSEQSFLINVKNIKKKIE